MSYPHLSKPPIAEAVVDIQVTMREGFTASDLDAFLDGAAWEFPSLREVQQVQYSLLPMPGKNHSERIGGIRWNANNTRAVQARTNGYSFHVVNDYRDWDDLRGASMAYWERFQAACEPVSVTRCALRYINRVEIAVGREIADVLRVYPQLSAGLADGVFSEYQMRVVVPFEGGRTGIVAQTLAGTQAESGELILDIDVFSGGQLSPVGGAVWQEIDILRNLKNRCFFESLTAAALEPYL